MNFYKITFSSNYCGYDDEYVYASEDDYESVVTMVCDEAFDRTDSESFEVEEGNEELEIYGDVEVISEEEYNRMKEYGFADLYS